MYKRAFNYAGPLIFVMAPSMKCSYQNMATNISKTIQSVPGKCAFSPTSPTAQSMEVGTGSLRNALYKFKSRSSRFNTKAYEFPSKRKAVLGVGFSLGLLGFFEKKEELSVEDKILMELKRAILAIQQGEIKKAEKHLQEAWDMSTEEELEKAKTQILDIRANLAFQVGDLEAAEKLFRIVCQRLVFHQEVSVKDNAIVEISIKMSQIMALKGRHEESMSGFQYCVDTQKEKIEKEGIQDEDTLLLAAWSLHSLAQAYLSRGTQTPNFNHDLIKKASDLANEAYDYASKAIGKDSQQAIAISSDLASIFALQGDIDAALERYKECEAIAAEKHTYLQPAIRINTGSLYLQKGNYDEAERLCMEAKKLAEKYQDKESAMRAEECIVRSNDMRRDENEEERAKKETSRA